MRSRHTDWHSALNCAVLKNITGLIQSVKFEIRNWKIPKDIKLADELVNYLEKVDLLNGAELFYELLQSGRLRLPGNYPMLQGTVLGSIVARRTPVVTQYDPLAHFCYEFPREEEDMLRLPHYPGCKDKSSTARTWSAVGRGAKNSMAHNSTTDETHLDKVFHYSDANTGTTTSRMAGSIFFVVAIKLVFWYSSAVTYTFPVFSDPTR